MKRTYAYLRVSTKEQSLERQYQSVFQYCKENNIEINDREIITDKQSGKDFKREGYQTLKNNLLRPGDTLIITEIDRLGRDMNMIKDEWQELTKLGIGIIVLESPILNTVGKSDLETNLISNIVFEILSYVAEKQRQKIKQTQAEGVAAMKTTKDGKKISSKTGRVIGRPELEYPSNWEDVYNKWKSEEITGVEARKSMSLKKTSFYKLVKIYEEKNI